ncbi:MAG: tRNA guanosine(15) transglycosylase TgtA [Nitrososphaerota archaeon]
MISSFEIRYKDLLGRIAKLTLRGKTVETPAFVPVINPVNQIIQPETMKRDFGCNIVITNSLILYKRLRGEALRRGVHDVIGFDGVVATDSGGYQVLEYGDVDVGPLEIARFQEDIGTDIAIPLDRPTGLSRRGEAERTVEDTIANVRSTMDYLGGERKSAWAVPIQGGLFRDLIERCIEEYSGYDFDLYMLGSPTPLMSSYLYSKLVSMISYARQVIDPGKPLHLFGAGHPMLFALATAMGCDTFDSAAYILFAKEGRYMVAEGTFRLEQLTYLPCECRVCSGVSANELRDMDDRERMASLAYHNLNVCFREVDIVKQAIWEGRLFELLERRCRSHPALYEAFRLLLSDEPLLDLMERNTPISKRRGLFLFDVNSLGRPEIRRAVRILDALDVNRNGFESAVLIPRRVVTTKRLDSITEKVKGVVGTERCEVFTYGSPLGLVPLYLSYTYPFSHLVFPETLLEECEEQAFRRASDILRRGGFTRVHILGWGSEPVRGYLRRLYTYLETSLLGVDLELRRV